MRLRGPWFKRAAASLVMTFASAGSLVAQDATLSRVEQHTSEGSFSSAREQLAAWFDSGWDGAGREDRQRALWMRGRLTVDAGMAERDYRRLVVEYPGGPFSDEALLRLAQLAWARSDFETALRHLRMLVRDYPESEHRGEALDLTARLGGAPPTPQAGVPAGGPGSVSPSATMPSQASAPPPEVRLPEPEPGPGAQGIVPADFDGMPFTIELGAFSTEPPAETIAAAATAAGVEVRMVGLALSDLIHVRTGAFFSQMEAQARALALRLQGLPAAVVADRAEEEPR